MEEQKSYEMTSDDCNSPEIMCSKNCWGWADINEAASDVFNSIHRNLLEGHFIFGYKNTFGPEKSQLMQVVVVRFSNDVFGVGVVTSGYTMLLPQVPITYLEVEFAEDLKKWKIENYILNTYKSIINNIKNEITCN